MSNYSEQATEWMVETLEFGTRRGQQNVQLGTADLLSCKNIVALPQCVIPEAYKINFYAVMTLVGN
jgi:hypothetical protein